MSPTPPATESEDRFPACDIAILGAGPTGLALALALREGPWSVALFDAAPNGESGPAGGSDPRALALSEGSRQLLDRLGVWPAATAIREIDISQQGGYGTTHLHAEGIGLQALGHVARYSELLALLRAAADHAGLPTHHDCRAAAISPLAEGGRLIRFASGGQVRCQLVVHAEGAHGESSWQCDYGQSALVCEATPTLPHRNVAYERFTPEGPLALLPLGERYAIVRVVAGEHRQAALARDDAGFADELSRALGHRVAFSAVGPRHAFPLALKLRTRLHEGREVWIGNAAQTLHPVSGQGFNLGLRDAWTLAEALFDASASTNLQQISGRATFCPVATAAGTENQAGSGSAGSKDSPAGDGTRARDNTSAAPVGAVTAFADPVLAAWARSRQPDRLATAAFTDGLVRIFSNDIAPLRQARNLGLNVLESLPGLRSFVARRLIWGARGW